MSFATFLPRYCSVGRGCVTAGCHVKGDVIKECMCRNIYILEENPAGTVDRVTSHGGDGDGGVQSGRDVGADGDAR